MKLARFKKKKKKVSGTFCRNGPRRAAQKRFLTPFFLATFTALSLAGCSALGWKGFGIGAGASGAKDGGVANNRNAELGGGLRPAGKSSGENMLGLDPRAREIEKNLGL